MKQYITAKTAGCPCVLHPVSKVTTWQPISRGVSECKILMVIKRTMVWY
jgi:hypothetical protein